MYKMMIVDDEPLIREYMKTNIPLINGLWQVTAEAMDGCEALEIVGKQELDLIITDIKMPVMDGLEFCRIVSEKFPKQNIIILSGYDEFSFAKEAIRYGVYEYLLKPIVKDELKTCLDKITKQIENEKSEHAALKTLKTLSEDAIKLLTKSNSQNTDNIDNINEYNAVMKAREYIYSHYAEPISLDLIAGKIGISSSYLSNIFHKETGESYIKFLTRVRMEQASKLLKSSPSWKIYDISKKVGYISVKHFSYIFKQYFNMTPGEYQERYSNTYKKQ